MPYKAINISPYSNNHVQIRPWLLTHFVSKFKRIWKYKQLLVSNFSEVVEMERKQSRWRASTEAGDTYAFPTHFFPVIFRSIEAAKKKEKRKICKCDISGKNSKSNTNHKVKSYTFNKCKDAKKVCPKKCWRDGKKALKKKSVRDKMCRKYYKKCRKCKSKEVIKMHGHAKVEKCGYNKRYSYKMKLCCKKKKKKITGILC